MQVTKTFIESLTDDQLWEECSVCEGWGTIRNPLWDQYNPDGTWSKSECRQWIDINGHPLTCPQCKGDRTIPTALWKDLDSLSDLLQSRLGNRKQS